MLGEKGLNDLHQAKENEQTQRIPECGKKNLRSQGVLCRKHRQVSDQRAVSVLGKINVHVVAAVLTYEVLKNEPHKEQRDAAAPVVGNLPATKNATNPAASNSADFALPAAIELLSCHRR